MFETFAITPMQAALFGALTLPVTIWVIYTDVVEMKIKNKAVLAMLGIFAVAGLFLLPLDEYAWRWTHFAVVLVVGYLLSAFLGLGAGDMKYAAAVAPFVPLADTRALAMLFVIWSIVLLTGFFLARRSSALRTAAPDWAWVAAEATPRQDGTLSKANAVRKLKTPFGVALAPSVSTYFFLAAVA